jgi:hypothetical protein
MTNFPEQLKRPECKFVLLPKNKKDPPLHSFNKIQYDWKSAKEHKGNIGILAGYPIEDGFLAFLDYDSWGFLNEIYFELPQTFCVRTALKKLVHQYFIVDEQIDNLILEYKGEHAGELRAKNYYVLCPPSKIDGETYDELAYGENLQIAKISKEDLLSVLKPYIKREIARQGNFVRTENNFTAQLSKKVSIVKLAKKYGFNVNSRNRSVCLFHGGDNPSSLCFNDNEGLFKCFACDVKGNLIDFIKLCMERGLKK